MVHNYNEVYYPAYSLDDIRRAAQQDKFCYEGRKVNADIRNLGYAGDDVKRCIAGLVSDQFKKCLQYENAVYDVYICDYQRQEDKDQIYMKLRLLESGEIQVGIGSFHLA